MQPATKFLAGLACVCGALMAQQPDPNVTFEVASVRPSGSSTSDTAAAPSGGGSAGAPVGQMGGPGTSNPGRIFYTRTSLQRLLMNAYGAQQDQISGPDWLGSEKFDITANIRKGATQQQVDMMLQNLLIERFKLVLHRNTKDGPVYQLTVAKGGPKFKESSNPVSPDSHTRMESARINGLQRKTCHACTIADLISGVQGFDARRLAPGRIVDQTGLSGKYDFKLEYVASLTPGNSLKLSAIQSQTNGGQDIFTALEKQLGLKLENGRGPVDLLIVDHIERTATEN